MPSTRPCGAPWSWATSSTSRCARRGVTRNRRSRGPDNRLRQENQERAVEQTRLADIAGMAVEQLRHGFPDAALDIALDRRLAHLDAVLHEVGEDAGHAAVGDEVGDDGEA